MDIYDVIRSRDFVVLDTETTGLHTGEIVQIAVINSSGETLLDSLVKPVRPIPADATAIHGITNDQVRNAPTYRDLAPRLVSLLDRCHVLVYNAVYDRKMLHQSAEAAGAPKVDWKAFSYWHCVMETFAKVYGDWNEYRQSYTWKPLHMAAAYYQIPQQELAHTALADCRTTLAVALAMAQAKA